MSAQNTSAVFPNMKIIELEGKERKKLKIGKFAVCPKCGQLAYKKEPTNVLWTCKNDHFFEKPMTLSDFFERTKGKPFKEEEWSMSEGPDIVELYNIRMDDEITPLVC